MKKKSPDPIETRQSKRANRKANQKKMAVHGRSIKKQPKRKDH